MQNRIYKFIDGETTFVLAASEESARAVYCEQMLEGEPSDGMRVEEFPREKWDDSGIRGDDGEGSTSFSEVVSALGDDAPPQVLCSTCF